MPSKAEPSTSPVVGSAWAVPAASRAIAASSSARALDNLVMLRCSVTEQWLAQQAGAQIVHTDRIHRSAAIVGRQDSRKMAEDLAGKIEALQGAAMALHHNRCVAQLVADSLQQAFHIREFLSDPVVQIPVV